MRLYPSKRVVKRWAIGAAILIAVALIANGFMAWLTEHRLQTRIAAIRAAGDPASIADLAPAPIPDDQNAAAYLKHLAPRLDEFAQDHWRFLDKTPLGKAYDDSSNRAEPPTPEQIAAIRAILDKYRDLDTGLAAAANCTQYASQADYSLNYSQFLDGILHDQPTRIRTAARFLNWRSEVLVADGQSDEAGRRGLQMLRLARLYDGEPLLVNYLVGLALRGIAANSLYDSLAAAPVTPELHSMLDEELALQDDPKRMVRTLKTERAYSTSIVSAVGVDSAIQQVNPIWLKMVGWPMKRFYLNALDYYDLELESIGRPWIDAHHYVGRRQIPKSPTGYGALADLLIPALQAAYDADARSTSTLRALRVFNALRQYAEQNGHQARALEDLSLPKEATIDPFSDEPLKLKHTDDGWIVYSVMENGVDDGGDFADLKDYGLAPRGHRSTEKHE